jgi:adenine deaminase
MAERDNYLHRRLQLYEVTRDLAAVAMGREPADLIIKNGILVNVNTARIQPGIDVAVKDGMIALVGDAEHIPIAESTVVVDAGGRYLVPGFIDTHDHVESSMVEVRNFAAGILPHGTTTIACDNHELTNVFGLRAVELFYRAAQSIPLKVLVAMPVCVPSIPGFEDAGAVITAEEAARAYENGWATVQGEQMNFPGVIFGDPGVHAITAASLRAGVILTGHYASLDLNRGLNAFIASGQTACHEATTTDGALRRAELGCYAQQRYGSGRLDMPTLIKAVTENPGLDTRFFNMVTDDVTASAILEDGHLDHVVRAAIRQGVSPITAIQMVTINGAQLLEKSRWIGTISPGRAADILIVDDLASMTIDQVFCDGILVAEAGKLLREIPDFDYPEWVLHSIHLGELSEADFRVPVDTGPVRVRVMRIFPGMVHTGQEFTEMEPLDGSLSADPNRDLAKAAVFYRHEPKEGATGTRAFGFVRGLGFKPGVAFASTVSHDCHNLLVVGTDDRAMVLAANELIRCGGGITVIRDSRVRATVALPVGGLMSLEPLAEVARKTGEMEEALRDAGCPHDSIEMTISLLPLIVLEELHLSNQGLVELKPGELPRFVDLVVA